MRPAKPLKSQPKSNANQLELCLNISEKKEIRSGMAKASSRKKGHIEENINLVSIKKERKHPFSPLTFAERKIIEKYIKQNYSASEISRLIRRGKNTVIVEIRRNEGREKYSALQAQKDSRLRKEKADKKRKNNGTQLPLSPYQLLAKRVENMEMQLDIITTILKEIKNDESS